MKRKEILLNETEFFNLIKRMVREAKEDLELSDMVDDIDAGDEFEIENDYEEVLNYRPRKYERSDMARAKKQADSDISSHYNEPAEPGYDLKSSDKWAKHRLPDDTEFSFDDEHGELSRPEVVDLISDFFENEVLPNLSRREKMELKNEIGHLQMEQRRIRRRSLREDKHKSFKDRLSSAKENMMIGGGLGMAAAGAISSLGEITGWSEFEITTKIHDYIEQFGAGEYTGPLTVAMVVAGLSMALKGMSDRYSRKHSK